MADNILSRPEPVVEASLSGSQRLADRLAGGLGKGIRQIATDLVQLFLKDRSHRNSKRESRMGSQIRSTRIPHVRDGAGAANPGFSQQHSRSSLPRLSEAEPEFKLIRDALSDDGSPSHFTSTKQRIFRTPSRAHQMPITESATSPAASTRGASKPTSAADKIDQSRCAHTNKTPPSMDIVYKSMPSFISLGHAILRAASCAQPKFVSALPENVSVLEGSCSSGNTAVAASFSVGAASSADGYLGSGAAPLPAAPSPPLLPAAKDVLIPAATSLRHLRQELLDEPTSQIQIPKSTDKGEGKIKTAYDSHANAQGEFVVVRMADPNGCCTGNTTATADATAGGRRPPPVGLLYSSPTLPTKMRRSSNLQWSVCDFEVTRNIHKGYSGRVYKASCLYSSSDVVLKAYNLAGLSNFLRNQVLRELNIHSRLRHPGIVHLLAAFREGNNLVMVQEYIRGGSLERLRRKLGGRMSEFQAMHLVLMPLLGVLTHLHERGIVHRDIKPDNLLLTENWKLKLCDFGVSVCLREERAVTRTGSREYFAPEVDCCPQKQLPEDNKDNLELSYTAAVDVWSLGALMYELLVGFTPFPGGPPARKAGAQGSAGAALAFPAGISQAARAFVRDCLQLDPSDRPTVHQLLEHAWVREAMVAAEALIAPK
ncbi:hypothetical protein VaNZ11_015164 [Volvox africanus]|uniref:Protein kinase domain-containing protein n=1 Tax=Volvox africanus TaxID=51714 RepID=A0ABQ5SLU8_9CHLO|nr:hypothetical protein VaNZ11_015164 [Volvox africanus]